MKAIIRVAIVEDNSNLRDDYVRLLTNSPGFECCGCYADGESAVRDIPTKHPLPQVVLLDIQLPGMSGVDCAAVLKPKLPDVNIVMLTAYDNSDLIFRALKNGASGYLLKRTAPAALLNAICEVHAGGAPMSGHIARMVVQSFMRAPVSAEPSDALSPREEKVLQLVAQGLINKEIAQALHMSSETVRSHLKNIYSKLHVHSRTEAAMKYFR
jgi:DNA-binding NarL/FixJ family response regulator